MINKLSRRISNSFLVFFCCVCPILTMFSTTTQVQADDNNKPDLIILQIEMTPDTPNIGETAKFTVTIKNQGESPAGACRLLVNVAETNINSTTIEALDPNEEVVHQFNWVAGGGSFLLTGIIDSKESVSESNENNNTKSLAFFVHAPDLVISQIFWEPEVVSSGEDVTFYIIVKNQGDLRSNFGYLDFSINTPRERTPVPALEPSASVECIYYWSAKPGSYTLAADVDVYDATKESDESNNSLLVPFATSAPDLIIQKITWTPQNRTDQEEITMSITVANQGSGDSQMTWLSLNVGGYSLDRILVDSLKAQQSRTITYTWDPGPQEYSFCAIIDVTDEITEIDEDNNRLEISIPALGAPDFVLQSIVMNPQEPLIGHDILFTVAVKNIGSGSASGVRLKLTSNHPYNVNLTHIIEHIAPGETVHAIFTVTALSQELRARATVDPEGLITELDETNNSKAVSITPGHPNPTADIVIEEMKISPENPIIGETATITAIVANVGSSQTIETSMTVSLDGEQLGNHSVKQLDGGQSYTVRHNWVASGGTHTLTAMSDANNDVAEIDESNNGMTMQLTILSPDLAITTLECEPQEPERGDQFILTAVVSNQGNHLSDASVIEFFINGDSQGKNFIPSLEPNNSTICTFSSLNNGVLESLGIKIDVEDEILESDETNNEAIISFIFLTTTTTEPENNETEEPVSTPEELDSETTEVIHTSTTTNVPASQMELESSIFTTQTSDIVRNEDATKRVSWSLFAIVIGGVVAVGVTTAVIISGKRKK
ncbi:hypothetical protein JXI42_05025 [bacterium]|nr:hypothetical protein [bacterium]